MEKVLSHITQCSDNDNDNDNESQRDGMFIVLGEESKERDIEKARKESEEYLMVNFPADVRKNLKGIILPQTKSTEEKEKKSLIERQVESEGKVLSKETKKNEGNFSSGRDWS